MGYNWQNNLILHLYFENIICYFIWVFDPLWVGIINLPTNAHGVLLVKNQASVYLLSLIIFFFFWFYTDTVYMEALMEKYRNMSRELHKVNVDLEKSYTLSGNVVEFWKEKSSINKLSLFLEVRSCNL